MALAGIRKIFGDVITSVIAGYLAGLVSILIAGLLVDVYSPLSEMYDAEFRRENVLAMLAGIGIGIAIGVPYCFLGGTSLVIALLSWLAFGVITGFFAWKGTDRSIFFITELEYGTYWTIIALFSVLLLSSLWRSVVTILRERPPRGPSGGTRGPQAGP